MVDADCIRVHDNSKEEVSIEETIFFFYLLFIYYYFLFYPLKKLLLGERSTLLGEMLIEHCRFVYNIDMVMLSTMYANAM